MPHNIQRLTVSEKPIENLGRSLWHLLKWLLEKQHERTWLKSQSRRFVDILPIPNLFGKDFSAKKTISSQRSGIYLHPQNPASLHNHAYCLNAEKSLQAAWFLCCLLKAGPEDVAAVSSACTGRSSDLWRLSRLRQILPISAMGRSPAQTPRWPLKSSFTLKCSDM